MGLLNNAIPFSLLFLGQTVIGAGLASILNATTPIFTVIVASLLVKQETLQTHRIAGVLLGVVGVAVMLSSSLSGLATDPLWAQLCCLGAAVSYACAATFAHRFKSLPPQVSATGQLLGSSLIMLPVGWVARKIQGREVESLALARPISWSGTLVSLCGLGCQT